MIDFDPEMGFFDEPTPKKKQAKKKIDKSNLMDMVISDDTVFAFKEHNTSDTYRIRRLTTLGVPSWEKTGYRGAVDGLAAEGIALPKTVPVGRLHFDPSISSNGLELLDDGTWKVNTFVPPSWATKKVQQDLLSEDLLATVEAETPTLYRYFMHICAGSPSVAKRLMMWIIAQIRHEGGRVRTAWILRGDQGSGKSMLVAVVIRGLLKLGRVDDNAYCTVKSIQNLKEQYNSWLVDNLFALIDEADTMSLPYNERKELYNKLKMMITNPLVTVRAMHKDQFDATPHAAFVFTSNERRLFDVEETDRRFHVVDYVEGMVAETLGFRTEDAFVAAIEGELYDFARILHRLYLSAEDKRDIDRPEMTEEKQDLIDSSRTVPARFVHALKHGDLDGLWALVSEPLYEDSTLASDPGVKQVIATVAIIAKNGGGTFNLPGPVVNRMYSLATTGGKYPKISALLRERRMIRDPSAYDSLRDYDPAISEACGLSNGRIRGLRIEAPWVSEDGFTSLLEDRFISEWISGFIKREASSAVKVIASIANAKKGAA
jgi:hypothetical protein